jgi:Tol biopolymer transport system component
MRLSPDRRSLAYVKRASSLDSINIVSLSGANDRTILKSNDQRVYFASLAWSRDGSSIYFGREANWQIISVMGV